MGDVYLARDDRSQSRVALKLFRKEKSQEKDTGQRFQQEARAISTLSHPNAIRLFEAGQDSIGAFLAMELVDGMTLDALLSNGPLDSETAQNVALQVAEVLAEAHTCGILHRDIKPSNIMISIEGHVKVLDFGLAKIVNFLDQWDTVRTLSKTSPGLIIGTIPYLNPEQALGKAVDCRSDLFSFGITFYQAVTTRLPFQGNTPYEVIDRILHAEPTDPIHLNPNISPKMRYIVRKCLQKSLELRYQSAEELISDLKKDSTAEKWLNIEDYPLQPKKSIKRIVSFSAAVVVVLIIIFATTNFFSQQKSKESDTISISRYAGDRQSYELYLQGRRAWNERTPQGLKRSIDVYNQAILTNPSNALAYAGLALSYETYSTYVSVPPKDWEPKAMNAALRALSIDDNLAEAHTVLASVLGSYYWEWYESEREFKRAIEIDSTYATSHKWYAELFLVTGHIDEAVTELQNAQALEPSSLIIKQSLAELQYSSGMHVKGLKDIQELLFLNPEFAPAHFSLGAMYCEAEKFPQAIASYENALRLFGNDSAFVLGPLGYSYARNKNTIEARRILARLEKMNQSQYVDPWYFALIQVGLGERDKAFANLEKASNERSSGILHIKSDSSLASIRGDPRYKLLIQKMGLTQ